MKSRLTALSAGVPNLYRKTDTRNGRTYFQYRDPLSTRYFGLGSNEQEARAMAHRLNREAASYLNTTPTRTSFSLFPTLSVFVSDYERVVKRRVRSGEIAQTTAARHIAAAKSLAAAHGRLPLHHVNARHISGLLDAYIDDGKAAMAISVRTSLVDLFKEAQHSASVPPGYNPAAATKKPRAAVARQRLTEAELLLILDHAPPERRPVILLALVTAQRRSDVVNMRFSDIWDDALHVEQSKTGSLVAIPLDIHLDLLNLSLRAVIDMCRDEVGSEYIIHHLAGTRAADPGAPYRPRHASFVFSEARNAALIPTRPGKTPSSFHELRSLAERLYRAQGINTKDLLGHSTQAQTDEYNNEREKRYVTVELPKQKKK